MKKRLFASLVTMLLFAVLLGTRISVVQAADDAACGDGLKTLVFHWHDPTGNYENAGLHVWNTGTGGSGAPIAKTGEDDFGAYFNICIGEGTERVGIIPLRLNEDGSQNWYTKATFQEKNLYVDVGELFGEDGLDELHVFFVDNGEEVYKIRNYNPELNYIFVFYADEAARYEGWGVHTWGTDGGDEVSWDDPIPFGGTYYTRNDFSFPLKIAAIGVGDNATKVGFISHMGDTKAYPDDLFIEGDVLNPLREEGQNFVLVYYIAGDDHFKTKEEFFDAVNTFRIQFKFLPYNPAAKVGESKGTYAVSPNLIQVEFNQDIRVRIQKEDGTLEDYEDFSVDFFKLTEDGKEIEIIVGYLDNVELTNQFVIMFPEGFLLDHKKTYKLYYDNGKEDLTQQQKAEIEVDLDTEAPEIELTDGKTVIEIKQGAKLNEDFTFPDYVARDNRDGDITNRVFVPEGKGYLNTGIPGDYEITLAVRDNWGHYTELTFVIRVVEADQKGLSVGAWIGIIAGAVVLVGAVVGGFVFYRKRPAQSSL